MLFAGVSWSADGFTVEVIDDAGQPAAPSRQYDAAHVGDLIADLIALKGSSQGQLKTVVDSTNGLIDGSLSVAGLEVYRADPHVLGLRPPFGSVGAAQLAELGRRPVKAELPRLSVKDGTLRGRIPELEDGWYLIQERMDDMASAGTLLRHGSRDTDTVALSFDDGPHPLYTGQVLDVLARYDVPATFFCTGLSVNALGTDIARMAEAGHCVGNHTWSHPYLPDLTPSELREQVERTSDAITRVTGERPDLMRPPYGSLTPRVMDMWTGFDEKIAMWDVEVDDWAMPGADIIAERALSQARPGSVILMHDAGGDRSQTVEALPAIIEGLLERGLKPVTIPEIAV
ncbi:polysaccharide deacetylase family protein [Streptomyces sp. NPDC088387]|uniref:polysaccharide deacetylase family protein n=1 Tax=Streptomyces sp. NPDC088387 TaxID=3365859 RepID=UPI0038182E96